MHVGELGGIRGRGRCDPRRRVRCGRPNCWRGPNSPNASRCSRRRCHGSGTGRRARAGRSAARSRSPIRAPSCRWCLLALGGEIILSSKQGRRSVAADDFFTGLMSTARRDDELIEAVSFPCRRPGEGFAFREFARRHGDFAIVACAAIATEKNVRLAVGGVADRPVVRDFDDADVDDALRGFRRRARRARRPARDRRLSPQSGAPPRAQHHRGGARCRA